MLLQTSAVGVPGVQVPGAPLTQAGALRWQAPTPQLNAGRDEFGEYRDIAIADGMSGAWFIWLRLRGSAITVFLDMSGLELPSLEALFDFYLTDPALLCL